MALTEFTTVLIISLFGISWSTASGQLDEPIIFPSLLYQNSAYHSLNLLSNTSITNEAVIELSQAAESFSLEFFQHITKAEAINSNNFVCSPFSTWTVLMLLAEGASAQTYAQLASVLRLPSDLTQIRRVYKYLQQALLQYNPAVDIDLNQVLFFDENRPIDIDFQYKLEHTYAADYFVVNFFDPYQTYQKINYYVREKTKGKITDVINFDALNDAQMILISAIFFQGRWKDPFKVEDTSEQPFYDENSEKLGDVSMMYRKGGCSYALVPELSAEILRLGYGNDQKFSMIILLPSKKSTLVEMIDGLRLLGMKGIFAKLSETEEDPELEIYLPRFKINSDYKLNGFLEKMGLSDIFNPKKSNLSKISKHLVYVSQFTQKAVVEVNELGTTAAAADAVTISFQIAPSQFYVNRPFAFLIVERTTNAILFCGQVKNPAE